MKSPHRPLAPPDPAMLDDHRGLLRSLERRGLLRGGLSLGALSLLAGCDVQTPEGVERGLRNCTSAYMPGSRGCA